ncbi:MAG: hypothetical protein AB7S68_32880 [Polyangiaceae bacterium]
MQPAGAVVIRFPLERVRRPRAWRTGRDLASWALPLFERVHRQEVWLLTAIVAAGCLLSVISLG